MLMSLLLEVEVEVDIPKKVLDQEEVAVVVV
jgi:hypothetical protein